MQLWLFVSPVVYPASLIPGDWQYVYALNPMVDGDRRHALGAARRARARRSASCALGRRRPSLMLVAGVVYFRRTERFFADIV